MKKRQFFIAFKNNLRLIYFVFDRFSNKTINGELHIIQNEHVQLNSQLDLNRLQFKCQFNVKQKEIN